VGIYKQITPLILYHFSSRLVNLLNSFASIQFSNTALLNIYYKLINFTLSIPFFVPQMPTSITSSNINLAWIL